MNASNPNSDSFSDQRVLVTGGAGFIGSHTAERFLEAGAYVAVLDNFDEYYGRAEKESNIQGFRFHPNFDLIDGDIRDSALVEQIMSEFQPSVVLHLAARAGVRPSLDNPELYVDVNVRGTAIMLEAAYKASVKNFVFASSSSVYGNSEIMPLSESHRTDQQVSPYGATKKAGELLCHAYHSLYGMNIACLRFFTVYGPRQRPDLAIRKFVNLALHGQEIPVYGNGRSRRDYTHIRDIMTGIVGAVRWGNAETPRFGIFNLGSSSPVTMTDLLLAIERLGGLKLRQAHLPDQPGDVFQTYADTSLAQNELGFRYQVLFEDGLREFIEWMKVRDAATTIRN